MLDPSTNHTGTFTTGAAGDYVFYVKGDNIKDRFRLAVDGEMVAHSTNPPMATFASVRANLPAEKACEGQRHVGRQGPGVRRTAFSFDHVSVTQVGDAIDYYFFYGPEPDEVIAGYRQATGQAPLFPEWAIGYCWRRCRERYSSQQQILDAAAEFRKRNIPVDVIVQDWKALGQIRLGRIPVLR